MTEPNGNKPHFQIGVQWGEFEFIFTTEPQRAISHVFCKDKRGNVVVNRMVNMAEQKKGLDFYLAGAEIFIREAVTDILRSAGEQDPATIPTNPTQTQDTD